MYYILTVFLLAFGIYILVGKFYRFPDETDRKGNVSLFRRKQGTGERFYTAVTYPLTKIISKFIRPENYQKRKLEKDLARAGINLSPAEYYAKAYVTAGLVILSSFIFIPLGLTVITMCVMLLGIMLFFKERQAAREKLKKINGKILTSCRDL